METNVIQTIQAMPLFDGRDHVVATSTYARRGWRYQRDNQIMQIEEGQATQWPKEKGETDKQRSTKHYTEN